MKLTNNRLLPDRLKQSCILLRFASPIPRHKTAEFYRVSPSPVMSATGEQRPYLAEKFQPQRTGLQRCPTCRRPMVRLADNDWRCHTRGCVQIAGGLAGRSNADICHAMGPVRGVVKVMIFDDFVTHVENGIEQVNGCLLVLDRRYPQSTLAAYYRTAGTLGELLGIKIL